MKKGLEKALATIDGLQAKYQEKLREAIAAGDDKAILQWQSYLSALTTAARYIEDELKEGK